LRDGRRVAIRATLHSNESKTAVSIRRQRGSGLVVVTVRYGCVRMGDVASSISEGKLRT
jgi:hypothetical protein